MKYSEILAIAVLVLFSGSAISDDTPNDSLPTVIVVTTGGTIAEKYDPATGGVVPAVSGDDLLAAGDKCEQSMHHKFYFVLPISCRTMPLITRRSPATVHRPILSPTAVPMKTRARNGVR